jgi:hypothetical protein
MDNQIILTHPTIVEFFKERDISVVEDMLISLIHVINKNHLQTKNADITDDTPIIPHASQPTQPKKSTELHTINKYVLEEIGKEYRKFAAGKDELIGIVKETYRQSMGAINRMKMPTLDMYICDRLGENVAADTFVNQLKCELCDYYVCNSQKSLSAHQRGCKKYVGSL